MPTNGVVVVAGASGFLGMHFVKWLLGDGYDVVALTRNPDKNAALTALAQHPRLRFANSVDKVSLICGRKKITAFVNAATAYSQKTNAASDIVDCNLHFSAMLADYAVSVGAERYVSVDTFFAKPGVENCSPSMYTISKRQARIWVESAIRSTRTAGVNFRLEHVYGPGDSKQKFVPWLIDELLKNRPELDLSDGLQIRDFIYAQDVCTALLVVLRRWTLLEGELTEMQIGTGQSTRVKDFVTVARNLSGATTELRFGRYQPTADLIDHSCADVGILNALGWQPAFTVEAGLRDLISQTKNERR